MSDGADRQHYGLTLAVLLVAALAFSLQQTMVAPALPAIQHEFGTSTTTVTFVLTAFLLTASVATPILGRFGDMFGKERVLVGALATFAVGSLVCALSTSIWMLIGGRAIQGTAAALFPLAFGIIRDEFPPERVAAGLGIVSATFGIGGGFGLVLSGVIVDHLSFEWIFWIGFAGILIATIATLIWVPESPIKTPAEIDWTGAAMLSAALVALLVGISEGNAWGWGSGRVLGLFAAAVSIFAVWVRFERGNPAPLVDINLMRERGVWTTNAAALLVGFGMFGSFIMIPQLVQLPESLGVGFGANATEAGLFLAPSAVAMLFAGPLAGWMGNVLGSRVPMLLGTVVTAVAFVVLLLGHETRALVYGSSALLGIGIGFSMAAMANLTVQAVHPSLTGISSGVNTIMRTIGGSLGAQIAASFVAADLGETGLPEESGFELAFGFSAIVMACAFLASLAIPRRLPFAAAAARRPPGGLDPADRASGAG